ncbi:hypothetical protein ACA29_00005, partial [Lederbergia galactosidilytica]
FSIFHQIESWNEQCLAWLDRKGKYKVHNTIKKRPIEVFTLEKSHLHEKSPTHSLSRVTMKIGYT